MTQAVAVDASVLVAFFRGEPEAANFVPVLNGPGLIIGAPTVLEARIWCLRRRREFNLDWLEQWLADVEVLSFDSQLEQAAASAFRRFGKGLHSAELNFGDAMAYAVAVSRNAPLLFKGGDFGKTDVLVHPASVLLD